ncbi:nucleoside hydrolase [Kibdelosporangium lantanae]|uniref:Nucleoside hydrolase n=1 Tax=Kibdelosporangium lantanae TaxID=1497396 RepID=A0ABW3MRZ2_9PSEU
MDSVAGSRRAFALEWIQHYVEFYTRDHGERGCVLYDPLAAAIALNPELARYERHQIRVELAGNSRGATLISSRAGEERRPARVAVRADITRVLTEMRLAFHQAEGAGCGNAGASTRSPRTNATAPRDSCSGRGPRPT